MKRSFVLYKNMSEVLAHNEVVNRFSGHHIPPDWLQWQATYLTLIPSLINDPEEPAQLVRSGCTIDGQVNCRKACGNSTSMFSDSDTLWNCLTLATVSLRTDGPDGKDEVNSENVTEIDNVFQVGDFSTFGFPFTSYSACMEDSCSDLEFGDCSRGTNKLLKSPINNTGIENLSKILQKEYCRHVNVGIDFDIAGPGIITAYFIQFGLVFFIALSFKFATTWTRKLFWLFFLPFRDYKASKKLSAEWQAAVECTRFASAVASSIVDLQETQALFLVTVASAAIAIATNNSGKGLANVSSLQSWLINNSVLKGIVTAGSYPLLLIQLILHRSGKHWWYTMLFIGIYVILVANQPRRVDISTVLEVVVNTTLVSCGNKPGPRAFCLTFGSNSNDNAPPWPQTVFGLPQGVVSLNSRYQEPVYFISSVLAIDWVIHGIFCHGAPAETQKTQDPQQSSQTSSRRHRIFKFLNLYGMWILPTKLKSLRPSFAIKLHPTLISFVSSEYWLWVVKAFWVVFELVVFGMCILAIAEFQHFLGLLAEQGDELANTYNMSNWSFGQFVAVAVWFPIMSKFVSYIVVGIIDSLEKRLLDGRYKVTWKEHRETDFGSNHEDQNQETDPGSNDKGQSPENPQGMSPASVIQDREKTKTIEMEQGTFSEPAGRTT